MNIDDAEEYTQALALHMEGSWRQIRLAQRLGVPGALGLTTEGWVRERLGGYRKLEISERQAATVELLEEGLTTREAAEVLGVGKSTIERDAVGPNGPELLPAYEAESNLLAQMGPDDPDFDPERHRQVRLISEWEDTQAQLQERAGHLLGLLAVGDGEIVTLLDPVGWERTQDVINLLVEYSDLLGDLREEHELPPLGWAK